MFSICRGSTPHESVGEFVLSKSRNRSREPGIWRTLLLGAFTLLALALDLGGLTLPVVPFSVPASAFTLLMLVSARRSRPARAQREEAGPISEVSTSVLPATTTALPVIATRIDAEHRCSEISAQLAEWLNCDRSQVEGRRFEEVFGQENMAALGPAVTEALSGVARRLRATLVLPGQGERMLQIELTPEREASGAMQGCHFVALDVTQDQLELDEARHSERRLRAIMDQIPVTVSYIDADFIYRYVNRAQQQWLGKTEAEVIGLRVVDVVGERVFASIEPYLRRSLAGESVPLERQRVDRNGKHRLAFGPARTRHRRGRCGRRRLHRLLRYHATRGCRAGAAPARARAAPGQGGG